LTLLIYFISKRLFILQRAEDELEPGGCNPRGNDWVRSADGWTKCCSIFLVHFSKKPKVAWWKKEEVIIL